MSVRSAEAAIAAAIFTLSMWWTFKNRCSIVSMASPSGSAVVASRLIHVGGDERSHLAIEGRREQECLMTHTESRS